MDGMRKGDGEEAGWLVHILLFLFLLLFLIFIFVLVFYKEEKNTSISVGRLTGEVCS